MVSGAIAFVFGIAEALLLKNMLFSFTSGNYMRAAVIIIVKLSLYGTASILLVFLFLLLFLDLQATVVYYHHINLLL